MRIKLREYGVGTQINIYGQYLRVGGHNTILLDSIYHKETKEYLCDHLWLNKSRVPWDKVHDDFVVVKGEIYEYTKYYNQLDYNIMPIDCYLIKPFVYQNRLVFKISPDTYNSTCWFYSYTRGLNEKVDYYTFYTFYTEEILHLYMGNEKEQGYEIIGETDEQYDLWYENRNSKIKVYKSFDAALKAVNFDI